MARASLRLVPIPGPEVVVRAARALEGDGLRDLVMGLGLHAGAAPSRVLVDLRAVELISPLAQVVLLSMGRKLRARGTVLVLVHPSEALREQGRPLGLFDRLPTIDSA